MARKKQEVNDTAIRMCAGSVELMQKPGAKLPKGKFYYETAEGFVAIDNSSGKIRRKNVATLDECVAFFQLGG